MSSKGVISLWTIGNQSFALTSNWDIWVWGENHERETKIPFPNGEAVFSCCPSLFLADAVNGGSIIYEYSKNEVMKKKLVPELGLSTYDKYYFTSTDMLDQCLGELSKETLLKL
jgi:hypothetical protein